MLTSVELFAGAGFALRQRLARLDVAEFKLAADRTVVSRDQVKFRLMLAGINESQFYLSGSTRTQTNSNSRPLWKNKS